MILINNIAFVNVKKSSILTYKSKNNI